MAPTTAAAAAAKFSGNALDIVVENVSFELEIDEPKKGAARMKSETHYNGKKGIMFKLPPGECEWPRMTGNGNYQDGSQYAAKSLEEAKLQGDLTEKPPTAADTGFIEQDDEGRNANVARLFDEVLVPLEAIGLEAMVALFSGLKKTNKIFEASKMKPLLPLLDNEDALRAKLQEFFSPLVKKNKDGHRKVSVATNVFRKQDSDKMPNGLVATSDSSEDEAMLAKGYVRTIVPFLDLKGLPIQRGSAEARVSNGDCVVWNVNAGVWLMPSTATWGIKLYIASVQIVARGAGGGGGAAIAGFMSFEEQIEAQRAKKQRLSEEADAASGGGGGGGMILSKPKAIEAAPKAAPAKAAAPKPPAPAAKAAAKPAPPKREDSDVEDADVGDAIAVDEDEDGYEEAGSDEEPVATSEEDAPPPPPPAKKAAAKPAAKPAAAPSKKRKADE